jgi:hypothetical protein
MANTVKVLVAVEIPTPTSTVETLKGAELAKSIRDTAEGEVLHSLQHLNPVVLRVRLAREGKE